jgi:aminoglycoside phosphotransferase (APT) family kinase protein
VSSASVIDAALVRRLLAAQLPQWADLPVVPVEPGGWDNRSFRLGEDKLVRLPSARWYAAQAEKEQRWLPHLAAGLPLPVPTPLAAGTPSDDFPWRWSVYAWLPGETAAAAPPADCVRFATALAGFLDALHEIDAVEGPAPGRHNFFRGGPLATYDAETRTALAALEGQVDGPAALALWEEALASAWTRPPVWVHGDVAPGNLLVQDGRLSAVIDWGSSGVGDPACDLVIAWTFLDGAARAAFRAALPLDAETWTRARGWALWKAAIVLAGLPGANPAGRDDCRRIIEAVLAEHAAPSSG